MRVLALLLLIGGYAQAESFKPYLRFETGTHAASATSIDVDPTERLMVSTSADKTARVWDLRSGRLLKILRPPIGHGDEGQLNVAAFSPDGAIVAVGGFTGGEGSANHPIYIFDHKSGAIWKTITGLPETTIHLAYSKDGRYLAAALAGRNGIRIFETGSYAEVARDEEYGSYCPWLEFSQSGRLVTASFDGFVRLYSSDFHLLRQGKPPDGFQPYSSRFSPDGKLIAVGFDDSTVVDVLSAEDLSSQYKLEPPVSNWGLARTSWSADGRTLCAAGRYQTTTRVEPVLCWTGRGNGSLKTFPVAGNTIRGVFVLHDGAIAFCDANGAVGVLDPSGFTRWRAAPDLLDYRGGSSFPRLSSDGNNVEVAANYFNGKTWTEHQIKFSVPNETLEIDSESKSPLQAPATTGLAIDGWKDDYPPVLDGRALPLMAHEISRSLAISPIKNSFVLGTECCLREFDHQGRQVWITTVPGAAVGVNISADSRFVVATLGDGTIRWYTFEKGVELLALFVDRDLNRWVAWNPDGFFTFESGGDALVGYQINRGSDHEGEFVKVDQLREAFYRPDLIAQILKPAGAEATLAARNRIGDISSVLSGGLPPQIELISPAEATVTDEYLLKFRIKDLGGGHGRIVYRIDGAEIEGRGDVDITGTGTDTINRYIPVAGGTHSLTVTVYSANGKIESSPKTVQITRGPSLAGSNLYVIAAGISHYSDHALWEGVKFASADADDVSESFKGQEGKGLYRRVSTFPLPDSQATFANIRAAVTKVAKTIQPGDTFILYLAGHGIAAGGDYYFIPWESNSTNQEQLLSKSLNREAIQRLLKQIPTNNSVLILDTCAAGAFLEGRSSDEKSVLDKLSVMSGRWVFAASNTKEMAMEGYENHGVFTYALLEGLEKSEANANGDILIDDLGRYLRNTVPRITNDRWHINQSPQLTYQGTPFPIARKLAH